MLVRTGVGRKRAQNATQQVIDKFNPEVIISMGYAGALTEGLNVGAVSYTHLTLPTKA